MKLVKGKDFFRLRWAGLYALSKLNFLHGFLPKDIRDRLPVGWNNQMFWLTFKTGGQKIYGDYYAPLREPNSYQPKVQVAEPYRLSEEDIRDFYDRGFIGPFTLMSPEEAEAFREHALAIANSPSKIYSYEDGDYGIGLSQQESLNGNSTSSIPTNQEMAQKKMNWRDRHLEDEKILSLFTNPEVTERCAQLLGPDLVLWRTQFFPKSKSMCGTPWHQATTYLFDNMAENVVLPEDHSELFQLTVWIALTDTPKDKAPMAVVRGSHRGVYPMMGGEEFKPDPNAEREKNRLGTMSVTLDYEVKPEDVNVVEMKAGQFFIFSERAIHGSLDNYNDEWRWGLNGRVVPTHTRLYTDKMRNEGHSYRTNNIINLKLDKWKGILIRGEDRYGFNRTQT